MWFISKSQKIVQVRVGTPAGIRPKLCDQCFHPCWWEVVSCLIKCTKPNGRCSSLRRLAAAALPFDSPPRVCRWSLMKTVNLAYFSVARAAISWQLPYCWLSSMKASHVREIHCPKEDRHFSCGRTSVAMDRTIQDNSIPITAKRWTSTRNGTTSSTLDGANLASVYTSKPFFAPTPR